MGKSKPVEKPVDLTDRLRQLQQLDAPTLVAPRQPSDDALGAPAMRRWAMRDVVPGGGRVYVVGADDGPRFRSATWLQPARRPAS